MNAHKMSIGRMLGYLHRQALRYLNREFSGLGLNGGLHAFLMYLYHHDGITQKELSEYLHIDKAHTTRVVHKLIDLGYIFKRRNPCDQRSYLIYFTEKARAVEGHIHQVLHNWTDRLSNGFSAKERETVVELLSRMIENLAESDRQSQ
jgi:DNA-binding MarR family transcriptional regulator